MTSRRVLLTGAAGLLGHWLIVSSPPAAEIVPLTFRRQVRGLATIRADLRDPAAVSAAITDIAPTLVIHAAYAKDRTSIVDATRNVVDAAASVNAAVLFVSSDAVFAGDGAERAEDDPTDTTWEYGRWKADAERIVDGSSAHTTVVRLPLLTSIDPDDHMVGRMRSAAEAGQRTRWFTDEWRLPVRASDAAVGIWRIAELRDADRSGAWHLAGAERLSRFEIARRLAEHAGLAQTSLEPDTQPEPRAEGDVRPRDIALSNGRARSVIDWNPRPVGSGGGRMRRRLLRRRGRRRAARRPGDPVA